MRSNRKRSTDQMGICEWIICPTFSISIEMASGRSQDMANMCLGLSLWDLKFLWQAWKSTRYDSTVRRGAWPFSLNIIYPDFCRRLEEVAIASFSYDIKGIRTFRTLFNPKKPGLFGQLNNRRGWNPPILGNVL